MPEPWTATIFPYPSPGPIVVQGHTLWLAYWLDVTLGDRVYLIFESTTGSRPQGVRVAFEKYYDGLETGGDEGNKVFLWEGRGPRVREIDMVRVDKLATLSFTNCWRERAGAPAQFAAGPSWLEPDPQPDGTILLHGSDGTSPVGEPTIVFRIVHERAGQLQRAT